MRKIRKGALVRLRPDDPEIQRILEWENHPSFSRCYMARRPTTPDERQEWRDEKKRALIEASRAGEDTFSIAFDDAGESRLPPRSVQVPLPIDRIYVVDRARCRVELGWGNPTGGMTKILDTHTGEVAYVPREMLVVIDAEA
tara:strand:+ start:104 stop:529 length:426 start_codon:yes stop_codon:yes gene_type:complete